LIYLHQARPVQWARERDFQSGSCRKGAPTAWHVGLPSKSGVGGGIVAVVPGKGAIAVFAPPLDEAGNSVKAQKVIAYVAKKLDINLYSPGSVGLK
jgi:glutaminase